MVPQAAEAYSLCSRRLRLFLDGYSRSPRAAGGSTAAGLAGTGSTARAGDTCSGAAGAALLWEASPLQGRLVLLGCQPRRHSRLGHRWRGRRALHQCSGCPLTQSSNDPLPSCTNNRQGGGHNDLTIGIPGMSSEERRITRRALCQQFVRGHHGFSPPLHSGGTVDLLPQDLGRTGQK